MGKVAFFISDLHLGRGDELDDFPSENENALAEFLDYQSQHYRGIDLDMVVLGDFLDIWQVADKPEKEAEEGAAIRIEIVEDDQIRRVKDVVKAHPLAFDRLGAFLRSEPQRHRAIFVIGNHDHSLVNDKVQKVICSAVSGGDAGIESRISFRHFYDEPGLRTYAEHGNQYDANNKYKKFVEFGDECPGHYFVRLFWNRLEHLEPNLETYVEGWWNCFRAIWQHKLWSLLKPAFKFFRQYRTDRRSFEKIDIPGVPFFAASAALDVPTTGKPLAGFPDLLFSDFTHPQRVFSTDNQTEDQLRALYHDPINQEFRDWVDEILREKFGTQAPPVPSTRVLSVPTYGLFHDENVSAVAGMFAPTGESPRTNLLRGSALDDAAYDYVIFGHTHEEKQVPLIQRDATYFNTGTWSARRDPQGTNVSRLCFIKIVMTDNGKVTAVQDFWRPSGQPYETTKELSFAAPRTMPARAITAVQPRLLEFFTRNHKPGLIGIVGTRDVVGIAIREAQRAVTRDGAPSLWSHCFILGDFRLDRRGTNGAVSKSPYLFESDLHVQITQPQIRNGAQENWIGKWCKGTVEHAAVIDFNLTPKQAEEVLATAHQLSDEQTAVLYPVQELLGTWLAIITGRQWLPNPLDDPRAMYCSSFVRHCYQEAGRDFLDESVSVSNTTPEDIAKAAVANNALIIYESLS